MKQANFTEIFTSIQGEGLLVGIPQVFVRFSKCNLKCKFCDTNFKTNFSLSSDQLVNLLKQYNFKWLSLTGGEPLLYADFLNQCLPSLKKYFKIYLETNGTLPKELCKIIKWVDFISMDFKISSATGLKDFTKEHYDFLQISKTKKCLVKAIITSSTTKKDIENCVNVIEKINPKIPLILQPVSLGKKIKKTPDLKKLLSFYLIANKVLKEVRIIPQVHLLMKWK
ncbi:MAG: 7-carboxy-7-deazaguanine synthase QueE [bacterium]